MELTAALDIARGYCGERPVAFMAARRVVAALDWHDGLTEAALCLWAKFLQTRPGAAAPLRHDELIAFPVFRAETGALLLIAVTDLPDRNMARLEQMAGLLWTVYQTMPVDGTSLLQRCHNALPSDRSVREELLRALNRNDWIIEAASDDLGWSKPTLYKYAAKFGIAVKDRREPVALRRARRLARV